MNFEQLLRQMVEDGASDLHLKAGLAPVIRKDGQLNHLSTELPTMTSEGINSIARALMNEEQYALYNQNHEVDLGYGVKGLGRFRLNLFKQRGSARIVIRHIPVEVPQLKDLNLPTIVQKFCKEQRGLVLVTGATGSGKSTTLAAMVDTINRKRNDHILTIEDPIEFLIRDRKSMITQRELGVDARDFATALRASLRQDPDVILIGEMRDKETIETALTAAETGHLVLSTLHTVNAQETINRILAVFEPHQQNQIRLQLASVLKGVVSQRLVKRADKTGFVPATEIMINNARIQEMILNPDRTREIRSAIEDGRAVSGMQSFDQSLMDLVNQKVITYDEAAKASDNPQDFAVKFSGISSKRNDSEWSRITPLRKEKGNSWDDIEDIEVTETPKRRTKVRK